MPAANIRSIAGPASEKGPSGSRLQLLTMLSKAESRKTGLIISVQRCRRNSSLVAMSLPLAAVPERSDNLPVLSTGTTPARSLLELTEHFVQPLGLCRRYLPHLLLDQDGINNRLILHLVVDASSVQGITYDVLPFEGEPASCDKLPEALHVLPAPLVPRREKDVLQLCQSSKVRIHRIFIGRHRSFLAPEVVLDHAPVFPRRG